MNKNNHEIIYAGFWRRFSALILDSFLLSILITVFVLLAALIFSPEALQVYFQSEWKASSEGEALFIFLPGENPLSIYMCLLFYGISPVYYVLLTSLYGATPGKRALGIAVLSASSYQKIGIPQSIARFILFGLSLNVIIPFLFQPWAKKRQALHDMIAKTIVIKGKFVRGELTDTDGDWKGIWIVRIIIVSAILFPVVAGFLAAVSIPMYQGYMDQKAKVEAPNTQDWGTVLDGNATPMDDVYKALQSRDFKAAANLIRPIAEEGLVDAQYILATLYSQGKGVPEDPVYAYMWFSLANASGEKSALKLRSKVAKRMTKSEVTRAQELSKECAHKNYPDKKYPKVAGFKAKGC